MIYITGDFHSEPFRLSTDSFYEQKEFSKDKNENTVIQLGDFGLIWDNEESRSEKYKLDWLQDKPFTTVFIDGNHDNHPRINSYPIKEWNGGLVHEIRPNVLHLIRGEVFNIEETKFFAFGGASSHDISDGILDYNDPDWKKKVKELQDRGKWFYRIKGLTWWEEELPTEEELQNGLSNLQKHNNKVDFVLSHCAPTSTAALMGFHETDHLTKYLEQIKQNTEYKRWFFGHYHMNKQITHKDICLYEQITRIV